MQGLIVVSLCDNDILSGEVLIVPSEKAYVSCDVITDD